MTLHFHSALLYHNTKNETLLTFSSLQFHIRKSIFILIVLFLHWLYCRVLIIDCNHSHCKASSDKDNRTASHLMQSSRVQGFVYFSNHNKSSSVERSHRHINHSGSIEYWKKIMIPINPCLQLMSIQLHCWLTLEMKAVIQSPLTINVKTSPKKKSQKSIEECLKWMGSPPTETLIIKVQNESSMALVVTIPTVLFPSNFLFNDADDHSNFVLAHFSSKTRIRDTWTLKISL